MPMNWLRFFIQFSVKHEKEVEQGYSVTVPTGVQFFSAIRAAVCQ